MAFVKVAGVDEIGEGELLGVNVGGKAICLARVDGEFYAFSDNCSHRDFPLSGGELDVDDCTVTCDWHGARFDIRTGAALSLPATRGIRVYPCRVEGDIVLVDLE